MINNLFSSQNKRISEVGCCCRAQGGCSNNAMGCSILIENQLGFPWLCNSDPPSLQPLPPLLRSPPFKRSERAQHVESRKDSPFLISKESSYSPVLPRHDSSETLNTASRYTKLNRLNSWRVQPSSTTSDYSKSDHLNVEVSFYGTYSYLEFFGFDECPTPLKLFKNIMPTKIIQKKVSTVWKTAVIYSWMKNTIIIEFEWTLDFNIRLLYPHYIYTF